MWQSVRDFFARKHPARADPAHPSHPLLKTVTGGMLGGVLALCVITAFGIPVLPRVAVPTIRIAAPPTLDLAAQAAELDAHPATYVREETLQQGETIAALLARMAIDDPAAMRFIQRDTKARGLSALRPGQAVRATFDAQRRLVALSSMLGADAASARELNIARAGATGFRSALYTRANQVELVMRSGRVERDFATTLEDAQVPASVAAQLTRIFSGRLDFRRDIRPGDSFRLVFEKVRRFDSTLHPGHVLAVEIISRGRPYQALRYSPDGGAGGSYYNFNGQPMPQAFSRTPVAYTRISSRFGSRSHPLSLQWTHHNGIDFAAPAGTPVFATGAGMAEFIGTQNGYGKVVMLRHPGGYSTYYAHLSGFNQTLEAGSLIAQGQLLGYVGQSGWATGPHLHYELRYRNEPIDPLGHPLAGGPELEGAQLRAFSRYADHLVRRIELLRAVQPAALDA